MRSGEAPPDPAYPDGGSELSHLLGYFHQDVWEDFSTDEEVWEFFVTQELAVSLERILFQIDKLLESQLVDIQAFIQSHSGGPYNSEFDSSREWLVRLRSWLVQRIAKA